MILAKRQYILQLIGCYIFSLGMTVCFWMLKPSSALLATLLLFVYAAYAIAECVFIWKRCNFRQTVLSLAPQKLFALIVSMLLCKQCYIIPMPTPRINFDGIVFLFLFYVPIFLVPALFTMMKKGIEEKTKWGKLYFWGNLVVLCASQVFSVLIAGLFSSILWKNC